MATAKTRKVTKKAASKKAAIKKAISNVVTPKTVSEPTSSAFEVLAPAQASSQSTSSNVETSTATTLTADAGWVFYFSVHAADVSSAWSILSDRLSGKAVRTGRISAAEYFASDFAPRYTTRGDLFVLRLTQTSKEDLGMLAGEIEDAFRDAGVRPGPMLPDTRTIEGVQYTYYRNETDDSGKLITAADLAAMRKDNPFLVMYNPLEKPDPWDDLYYEYVPSVEDVDTSAFFGDVQPVSKPESKGFDLDVEDFDADLGNLLNELFKIGRKYLTQPEGVQGWVFDKGLGRLGKPSYRFYACAETIKPVRKTVAAAGFNYTIEERGEWHGVQIPLESFKTVQRTLSEPGKLAELRDFYKATAKAIMDNVPALPAPENLPFADDTLFVSDL